MSIHHPNNPWTDERTAELGRLWAEGKSCGQIATAFGISRNSVIGKARRLRLNEHAMSRKNPGQKREAKPVPPRPRPKAAPVAKVSVASTGVPLLQAGIMECRWPTWGDNGAPLFLVCGNGTVLGDSYCPAHKQKCVSKGTLSERRAA